MLSGLPPLTLALLLAAGIVLDLLLGEARRWHPGVRDAAVSLVGRRPARGIS